MKKKILAGIQIITLIFVLLTGCGKAETVSDENVTIRIADQPGSFIARVAQEQGFFTQELGEDVDVEIIDYAGGGPAITESFSAGEVDFGFLGDLPVITCKANGTDIKIVGFSETKEKTDLLVTLQDSGIQSVADLKGKKVGVPVGTTAHSMLLKLLEQEGLTQEDIELVNLSFVECVTSLQSGDIDAALSFTNFVLPANKDGANIVTVADATDLGTSNVVLAARNEFVQAYPDETAKLLKAFDDAVEWMEKHEEETISLIAEAAEQDPDITRTNLELWDCHIGITAQDYDNVNGILDFAKQQELIENDITVEQLIDVSYLEKAGIQ